VKAEDVQARLAFVCAERDCLRLVAADVAALAAIGGSSVPDGLKDQAMPVAVTVLGRVSVCMVLAARQHLVLEV